MNKFLLQVLRDASSKSGLIKMSLSSAVDLSDVRKPYGRELFLDGSLKNEPFEQFTDWFKFAQDNCKLGFEEINAAALSTCTTDGKPSCRMVLMKGYGKDGFRFFTNYESRKGQQLKENPFVSVMFYWPSINRSVHIEGKAEKMSSDVADAYWTRRPVNSQASAFVSEQSKPVASRKILEERLAEVKQTYTDQLKPIPRPPHWGGYLVVPETFEFWNGHEDRLHDRIKFRKIRDDETVDNGLLHKGEHGWCYERLQP